LRYNILDIYSFSSVAFFSQKYLTYNLEILSTKILLFAY